MANFGELSGIKQLGILIGVAVLATAGLFFTVFKTQREANAAAQQRLEAKRKEQLNMRAQFEADIARYRELTAKPRS